MIKISKQIIKANECHIKVSFVTINLEPLHQVENYEINDYPNAIVHYLIKNEENQIVDQKSIRYNGNDYITWWNNFNSGTFLLEEYLRIYQITNYELTEDTETEFLGY